MKIHEFFKTIFILGIILAITGALGYFVYQTFKEKPLEMEPPYIKEEQDTDIHLFDTEDADPLIPGAQIQQLQLSNCTTTIDSQEAQQALNEINTYRAQNGLGSLKLSPTLMKAAAWFADDLLANSASGHIDSLGRDPAERASDCGYPSQAVGENTAGGVFTNPIDWWKQSPGHNENFLKPQWKTMGYGVAQNGGIYRYVWIAGSADDSGTQPSPSPTSNPPTATPTTPQQTTPTNTPTVTVSPSPTSQITPTVSPTNTLTPSPTSGTLTPQPTNNPTSILTIQVEFPGIGLTENNNPTPDTKLIRTELLDENNTVVGSEDLIYKYENGVYKAEWGFGQVNGLHQLRIDPQNALTKGAEPEIFRITAGQNVTVTAAPIVGDVNGDNILDIRDYNSFIIKLITCYLVPNCGEEHLIDFNANGVVDEIDYNILLRSYTEVKGS